MPTLHNLPPTFTLMKTASTRIWDLPTRLFHWLLAAAVIALIVTAKVGGNAMEWHIRLGHVVLVLLLFRGLWGIVGGHWSRFATFVPTPTRLRSRRGLSGAQASKSAAGHSPLGALSVVAMLLILTLQVGTGLVSDDEIAFSGPLARFISGDTVAWASVWHKGWGQWLLLALLGLHLCAIAFYAIARHNNLVPAMVHGNQQAAAGTRSSTDTLATRLLAAALIAACSALAWWVYGLGGAPIF